MKKILSAIFISSALLFSACADKSSDKKETYGVEEVATDKLAVDSAERALKDLGFEFVETTTTVTWDDNKVSKRWTETELLSVADTKILPALRAYKEVAQKYVNKYGKNFDLRYQDGRVDSDMTLKSDLKATLKGRLDLVNKTISAIQNRKK